MSNNFAPYFLNFFVNKILYTVIYIFNYPVILFLLVQLKNYPENDYLWESYLTLLSAYILLLVWIFIHLYIFLENKQLYRHFLEFYKFKKEFLDDKIYTEEEYRKEKDYYFQYIQTNSNKNNNKINIFDISFSYQFY